MMKYYLFRLIESSIESAERELAKLGLSEIFVIEDDAEVLIGGHSKNKIDLKKIRSSELVEEKNSVVDWEKQWELFAENFSEGKAQIELTKFGVEKTLFLLPGPGFGDLSHPTTYLMLEMMQEKVEGASIIDIGTGSGILSLAAILLGAKIAVGIDIDPKAIKHAKANSKLNGLEKKTHFSKSIPKKWQANSIFLMNMIFPEQKELAPKQFNPHAKLWIISGILKEQKKEYLEQAKKWGWIPISEDSKEEWLGFVFKCKATLH